MGYGPKSKDVAVLIMFSKNGLVMNAEQHVLFLQICSACIKCLRYHMTKQTDRDVNDYCKKLIEKLFTIVQGSGDSSKRIAASDLFLQGGIAESSLLFGTFDSFSSTEEILSKDIAPVIIRDLDARMLENLTEFKLRETAFYCPSSIVHALVNLSEGAGRGKWIFQNFLRKHPTYCVIFHMACSRFSDIKPL